MFIKLRWLMYFPFHFSKQAYIDLKTTSKWIKDKAIVKPKICGLLYG